MLKSGLGTILNLSSNLIKGIYKFNEVYILCLEMHSGQSGRRKEK